MEMKRLIESIDLTPQDLEEYLIEEVKEFIAADDEASQLEELEDILFSLRVLTYAKMKKHLHFERRGYESKIANRLSSYATISRKEANYLHNEIRNMKFGVVHFVFGNFANQWKGLYALKNGTVAEIVMLTDNCFCEKGKYTNHLLVTFGAVDELTYEILYPEINLENGNTVLCKIPDFMYIYMKQQSIYREMEQQLALQVVAALKQVHFEENAFAHFHSWEGGFLTQSTAFQNAISSFQTLFSPYLTVGRLQEYMRARQPTNCTLNQRQVDIATYYEKQLMQFCVEVLLESKQDKQFYESWVSKEKLKIISFCSHFNLWYIAPKAKNNTMHFIAGGRPVQEKGFYELLEQFAELISWGKKQELTISLDIFCKEYSPEKGADYILLLEKRLRELGINKFVRLRQKVSEEQLIQEVKDANGLIVPSLFDPFCLMPCYAIEQKRLSIVSQYAGISENIYSREYVFDPEQPYDLIRAVEAWYVHEIPFVFNSHYQPYTDVYLRQVEVE